MVKEMSETTNRKTAWDELNDKIVQCKKCPRLVAWREEIAETKRRAFNDQVYWAKPVPGFGDHAARILVVGLAPGAHGSNRTGRMFTGDASGNFLFPALYNADFSNQPDAPHVGDGLILRDVFITAVARCVPPGNKPTQTELNQCKAYLLEEIALLKYLRGIVALGQIAFQNILKIYHEWGVETTGLKFSHAGFFDFGTAIPWVITSYHPSRQNTQTGRLTRDMFAEVWQMAKAHLE